MVKTKLLIGELNSRSSCNEILGRDNQRNATSRNSINTFCIYSPFTALILLPTICFAIKDAMSVGVSGKESLDLCHHVNE